MYSLDGKLLLEDNRQLSKRTEYIYAVGRLVAKKIQPITSAGVDVVGAAATVTYIHTDFLGSPVAETNASGAVDKVERFTPYGEPADLTLDAGPGFTGHATDVATGLTYMQQRYYDPELGRFLIPDPVGPEEDFINHFNRYNYAQNNPVRYTDPDGRTSSTCPRREYQGDCIEQTKINNEGEALAAELRQKRVAAYGDPASQRASDVSDYVLQEAALYILPAGKILEKFGGAIKGFFKFGKTQSININSKHILKRFPDGLPKNVERAIRNDIGKRGYPGLGNGVQRVIQVDGKTYSYRAFGEPGGSTDVGTVVPGFFTRDISAPKP